MRRAVPVLLALLLAHPAVSAAQSAGAAAPSNPHQGFWVGFGLGGGMNLADFAEGVRAGPGGYLRLGGTLNQKILLGGEVSGWGRDIQGSTFTESGLTATIMFFPVGQGIFLKGGAGFSGWATSAAVGSSTTTTTTATGFAGTVGVGYDLQLGGNLYLTPNVDFLYHTLSSDDAAWANISSGSVLLFTLGLTWH